MKKTNKWVYIHSFSLDYIIFISYSFHIHFKWPWFNINECNKENKRMKEKIYFIFKLYIHSFLSVVLYSFHIHFNWPCFKINECNKENERKIYFIFNKQITWKYLRISVCHWWRRFVEFRQLKKRGKAIKLDKLLWYWCELKVNNPNILSGGDLFNPSVEKARKTTNIFVFAIWRTSCYMLLTYEIVS